MTSLEPAMPPIPVTCGASEVGATPPSYLARLREASHYRAARVVVKVLFAAEVLGVVASLVVLVATKRLSSPLLGGLACGLILALSFVGAELAAAVFDVADAALEVRFKPPGFPVNHD